MKPQLLLLPMLIAGLVSCDRIKDKALTVLEEKLSELPAKEAYSGPTIRHLTAADYEMFTQIQGRLVLVDFYADWCGPCRKLSPVLERVVASYNGQVVLGKVDVDHNKQLAGEVGVRGIPDVRIFKEGKQVDRFVGSMPESMIRARINAHTDGLPPAPEPPKPAAGEGADSGQTPKQPTAAPLSKDWLPPGVERR